MNGRITVLAAAGKSFDRWVGEHRLQIDECGMQPGLEPLELTVTGRLARF